MKKLAIVSLFVFLSCSVSLAVTHLITYQGVLRHADGRLVDANLTMTFRIYGSSDAEEPLWSETYDETNPVEVRNGLFTVLLGEVSPLLESADELIFNGNDRWLGVTIGDEEEMEPRFRLASVPYAYQAEYLGGYTAGNFARFEPPEVQVTTAQRGLWLRSTASGGIGVCGEGVSGPGVFGNSTYGAGIRGESTDGYAGYFKGGQGLYVEGPITTDAKNPYFDDVNIGLLENPQGVFFINCAEKGGDITVTLPPASSSSIGRVYYIYKVDSDPSSVHVIVAPTSGNKIYERTSPAGVSTIPTNRQWECIQVTGYTANAWIATVH